MDTSKFEEWFENIEDEEDLLLENNSENVHSLYHAVKNCEDIGPFTVEKKGVQLVVKAEGSEEPLQLDSVEERNAFRKYLLGKYVPEEMTLEAWRQEQRGTSRD